VTDAEAIEISKRIGEERRRRKQKEREEKEQENEKLNQPPKTIYEKDLV
jgi:hypothetical protein